MDDVRMRAVMYEQFQVLPEELTVADPACPASGVVIRVEATGLCRSDWHGWMGHDPDIGLPHIPGHELAGSIVEAGPNVRDWRVGDRVTTPFVIACGTCATCRRGDHQVCEDQQQPGFTQWGSFAELVAIDRVDTNLVAIPESMSMEVAAGLGCRFSTAYRAVVQVGSAQSGDWVAVHGCGGVGLSAVMIAAARGAQVIAVDLAPASLDLAVKLGATVVVDGRGDVVSQVLDATGGGVDVSLDALGSTTTMVNSIRSLRRGGKHVQVGLLAGTDSMPGVPMGLVIGSELQVLGSHGMAAHSYPSMMTEIAEGLLDPQQLIHDVIGLGEAPARLAALGEPGAGAGGITIIRP